MKYAPNRLMCVSVRVCICGCAYTICTHISACEYGNYLSAVKWIKNCTPHPSLFNFMASKVDKVKWSGGLMRKTF